MLAVAEIFGPTFQGEGPSCGRRAAFVRLAGCNLACWWCDTPYTWDWTGRNGQRYDPLVESTRYDAATVLQLVLAMSVDLVVVTGGEPMLQHRQVAPLLNALAARGVAVEIETNGTVVPSFPFDAAAHYNVSLKLAHAGNGSSAINEKAIAWLRASGRAVWKFVAATPADLDEIDQWVRRFGLAPVWVMPLGITSAEVTARLRILASPTLARGWNLTPRLHTLIWEDARGR